MQQCAEHVEYQLPNEHTSSICTENGPKGMWNDFEAAAAHILPYDPVARKGQPLDPRGQLPGFHWLKSQRQPRSHLPQR